MFSGRTDLKDNNCKCRREFILQPEGKQSGVMWNGSDVYSRGLWMLSLHSSACGLV